MKKLNIMYKDKKVGQLEVDYDILYKDWFLGSDSQDQKQALIEFMYESGELIELWWEVEDE